MLNDLKRLLNLVPEVSLNRRYWFVRTEGGLYYNAFKESNLVAIGYNEIAMRHIDIAAKEPDKLHEHIYNIVKRTYPEEQKPGLVTSQIIRFVFEVKKGDIVVIPGPSSHQLLFGTVVDDKPDRRIAIDSERENRFPFEKSRTVKWQTSLSRWSLNPNLFSLFFTHQAISCGDEYASHIDNTLNDLYVKNGKMHLLIDVKKDDNINARKLFQTGLSLLDLTDELMIEQNISENTENVEVRINLNSPGLIELIGISSIAIICIGLIIVGLAGGGFETKFKGTPVKLKTPGLIKALSDFLKDRQKEKALIQLTQDLKIQEPQNLSDIINKLLK